MHFTIPTVLASAILSLSSLALADPSAKSISCDSPQNPCNTYTQYKQCSPEWGKALDACEKTGCIQWFVDPFNVCRTTTSPSPSNPTKLSCQDPANPCKIYTNYPQCSDKWKDQLSACESTGCIQWIQDPMNVCKTSITISPPPVPTKDCSSPKNPCNAYSKYPQCSPQWKNYLSACQKTGCIQWIQDPFTPCYKPKTRY